MVCTVVYYSKRLNSIVRANKNYSLFIFGKAENIKYAISVSKMLYL
jgi:hypothetical protein